MACILGYWGGLARDGEIAKKYKTREVVRKDAERRNLPLGGKMAVVDKDDVVDFMMNSINSSPLVE